MKTVPRSLWPGTRDDLQAAIALYRAALEEHKLTVGVPAPARPPAWFEDLARTEESFDVEAAPVRAWAVQPRGVGELVAVREITVGETLHDGERVVSLADDPRGRILDADGTTVRDESPAEALLRAQRERWTYIKALRQRQLDIEATCGWNGFTWQAREADSERLDRAIMKLEDPKLPALLPPGIEVPSTIPWRSLDNTLHALTPDQARVLSAMMAITQQQVWLKSWALETAILAAKTVEQIAAVEW